MNELVFIDQYGLLGTNYYWRRKELYNLTSEELAMAGLPDDRLRVHKDILGPLRIIDKDLQTKGYRLYISEGYRPKAVYQLIYQKRSKKYGKEWTDRLVNMKDMPHSTGKTVDTKLWDMKNGKELPMRNLEDGAEALFVDFYRNKTDYESQAFQEQQGLLIQVMLDHGFVLGPKNEYFHFNYTG